jgi:undecaprenyl-diphosphatase
MDFILLAKAFVLGIVEGLTEFLPISSTGHLILVGDLLGFNDDKGKVFEIVIQTGAMFAILWEYRERFIGVLRGLFSDPPAQKFVVNLIVAFMPAALVGLAFNHAIKEVLFKPVPVAIAFIVGALIILWVERRGRLQVRIAEVDDMTPLDALKVGFVQCLGMIPGTSRSGATIIGGMLLGLSRKAATEFSFFLAIPTLIGAGAYSLWKERALLSAADLPLFLVGFGFSFVFAWLCVRWLLRYVSTHTFVPFAWYRIAFGVVVLATAWSGLVVWQG